MRGRGLVAPLVAPLWGTPLRQNAQTVQNGHHFALFLDISLKTFVTALRENPRLALGRAVRRLSPSLFWDTPLRRNAIFANRFSSSIL